MAKKQEPAIGSVVPSVGLDEKLVEVVDQKRLWRKTLGDIGEQIVAQHVTLCGWQILSRKFRMGRSSEVDIIAISPEETTTFIEVKTRIIWPDSVNTWHESATQSIDARKRKRIIAASRRYRVANQDYDISKCRYDVFLVGITRKLAQNLVDLKKRLRFITP